MPRRTVGIYISSKYVDITILGGNLAAPKLLGFHREEITYSDAEKSFADQVIEQTKPQIAVRNESDDDRFVGTLKSSPIPEQAISKVDMIHREDVSLAINEGLAKLKIRPAGVYSVLSSSDVMIRYFRMPQLPRAEQDQAIKFEARKYIPFKLDKIVSDFRVFPGAKSEKIMNVFFIAATKDHLNHHIDIFKKAGTETLGIDIVPFVLMRALSLHHKITVKENIIIVYLDNDKESFSIHIIENGIPFLTRDLKDITDDKDALFEKMASELRVSLDYYYRQKPHAEVAKIVICGERTYTGLDSFVAEELKIITETITDIAGVKGAGEVPGSAIISVGTAMSGLGRSQYSVNLSPAAVVIRKKKVANVILLEAIAAAFFIFVVFIFCYARVATVSSKLDSLRAESSRIPGAVMDADTNRLMEMKEQRLNESRFLNVLFANKISWAKKLDRIAKKLPQSVWIDRLTARQSTDKDPKGYPSGFKNQISIEGKAFAMDPIIETNEVNKFFQSLQNDEDFMEGIDEISLGSVDKRSIKDYSLTAFKILSSDVILKRQERTWRKR